MESVILLAHYNEWIDLRFESRDPALYERASDWFRENRPVVYYRRFYEWVESELNPNATL